LDIQYPKRNPPVLLTAVGGWIISETLQALVVEVIEVLKRAEGRQSEMLHCMRIQRSPAAATADYVEQPTWA